MYLDNGESNKIILTRFKLWIVVPIAQRTVIQIEERLRLIGSSWSKYIFAIQYTIHHFVYALYWNSVYLNFSKFGLYMYKNEIRLPKLLTDRVGSGFNWFAMVELFVYHVFFHCWFWIATIFSKKLKFSEQWNYQTLSMRW